MKSIKYFLFPLLIFIIGISIYVAVQPNSFDVTRERIIDAPATVIYNNVIDLKNWEDWSPWMEKYPESKITYSEPTVGVDASFFWEDDEGTGNIKTRSTTSNTTIEQDMQFEDYKPSEMNWSFTQTPDGQTKVTWQLKADHIPFMFKIYSVFSGGFENIFGPDFERGLEKLDSVVVADMKKYSISIKGVTQHSGGFYIYNTASSKINDVETKIKESLPKVIKYVSTNSITTAGPPFINYLKWDTENNAAIFTCCVPITSQVITTDENFFTGQIESFRAVKVILKGNHSNLKEAWEKAEAYIKKNGLESNENGPNLETYVTDSNNFPNPADWITELYIAIKD